MSADNRLPAICIRTDQHDPFQLDGRKVDDVGVMEELRKRWFVSMLSVAAAIFFTVALIVSAYTYVNVMDANASVVLMNAIEGAEMLDNGSLLVTIQIQLDNPSDLELSISTVSWTVTIWNHTDGVNIIPVASAYNGTGDGLTVKKKSVETFTYQAIVSDLTRLANIDGFINYSMAQGQDYTLETVPYMHDFRVTGWIADFPHDYQTYRETYLNDMIRIDLSYRGGEYL